MSEDQGQQKQLSEAEKQAEQHKAPAETAKAFEPNHGLTFASKEFIAYYMDGNLVAIEDENGHVVRYLTQPSSRHAWKELLGLNKAQYAPKKA